MELKSKRLLYQNFNKDDFEFYRLIYSDELIMKYAYYDCMKSREELEGGFCEMLELNRDVRTRRQYDFKVFSSDDCRFIGEALVLVSYRGDIALNGEIGYFILPEFWGMGYATEVARMMTEFCFKELGLNRVIASCNASNYKSENVMKKLGMRKEGEFKKSRYKNGDWQDELKYAILKEEWLRL